MKTLKIIFLSILCIHMVSCNKDEEKEEKETSFFQIKINNIEESIDENKIIIQYKLTDDQNIGVKGKTDTDFNIYEKVAGDDEDLSDPTEAKRYIVPTPTSYAYASMVVMDLSGSVIDDIDIIKSSSKDYINNLFDNLNSGNLKVGVYFFDGRTELQEVISFSNSKSDVIQAIESMNQELQQQEQTALYHGVSQACDLMNNQIQSFISNPELTIYSSSMVIFSDGQNSNYINIDRAMMNTNIQQTHNNTSFYCIAAGNDIDNEVIKNIGLDGDFTITDYSELNEGLNKVLNLIIREANSNYELEFCTAKKGIEVQFRIEVKKFQTVQSGQSHFNTIGFSTDYSCIINN